MLIAIAALAVAAVAFAAPPKYGLASWPEKGLGNHRVVLRVGQPANAVRAHIEWRRRDPHPEAKDIRLYDAATGERIPNVVRLDVNREFADLVFQPKTVPGEVYVYYLPYDPPGTGPFGEGGSYFPPEDTADPAWRQGLGDWRQLPQAEVVEIQARGEFHRMDPMEVIATKDETQALLAANPSEYLLFPEDRRYPIRMFEDLPYRWIERGPTADFRGEAQPGEYYALQIGVFAVRKPIDELTLRFSDLKGDARTIPASAFTCINLTGADWLGRPITKTFPVGQGKVRPLWIGVQVPPDAKGAYTGAITVQPKGQPATDVDLTLTVDGPVLADSGDADLWRMSRLRWLNSTMGIDEEVIPPFTPLQVKGSAVRCLNREVVFGSLGLPERIVSNRLSVLAAPMELVIESGGEPLPFKPDASRVTKATDANVERVTTAQAAGLSLTVVSHMEFDGCVTFAATLRAERDISLDDIGLRVPLSRDIAQYMMGFGKRGGYRPGEWHWKWDIDKANHMVWLGNADAGLQLKLIPDSDAWQVSDLRESGLPASWCNGGRGGADMTESGNQVLLQAYSGPRTLKAGEDMTFRFRLLITPFKPIDPQHWNWRYGDVNGDGTVLHIHQSAPQNPYINYPFLTVPELKATMDSVKTIRGRRTDYGALTYPAEGNLNPAQGALHVWTRVCFDPAAGGARQPQFNQALFSLNLPNEDSLGFYWNIDDRGMRTYVRHGSPERNQYPMLFGTHQPDWRQGQRHLLTLSWGDQLAIYIDGKLAGAGPFKGTVTSPLTNGTLEFSGAGFALDAIKITDTPYTEGDAVAPTADEHTLLLDTFANRDGGERTKPERGPMGTLTGVCTRTADTELAFSYREVEAPPKGVNIYYTVRELSNHVAEMWALRSLGDEVFYTGGVSIYTDPDPTEKPFLGYAWLREHLVTGYVPAWRTELGDGGFDAAIAQQGLSRWHNYYVEGLNWIMRATGVDGLYLDGIGYDREIMKRVAKTMCRANPGYRINFHSGDNWSPPWDRLREASPANDYLEHFPYLSNLWFGELYDYNMPPDYWFVEISGILFGLTGEMLNYENGGNPYRAMLYGMSGRQHPSCTAMWAFWDEFGIQDAQTLGYWDARCPVRTGRDDILATVYRKPGTALIALARWPVGGKTRPSAVVPKAPPEDRAAAAKLTNFRAFQGDGLADEQTEVYVTRDGSRLHIAFRCAQSAAPKADAKGRDGPVWEDDAVEVFIQPDPAQPRYLQFVGNSAGAFADAEGTDLKWNGDWTYRASVGQGYWEGEVSIPFAALGMKPPAEGAEIGFNVCRDRQRPSQQLSCWSPLSASFHEPQNFGRLVLSTRQPATREEPPVPGQDTAQVRLAIDWKALGLDPRTAKLTAPPIMHFQGPATFRPDEPIPVEPGRGWLIVVK